MADVTRLPQPRTPAGVRDGETNALRSWAFPTRGSNSDSSSRTFSGPEHVLLDAALATTRKLGGLDRDSPARADAEPQVAASFWFEAQCLFNFWLGDVCALEPNHTAAVFPEQVSISEQILATFFVQNNL
jgi:hypothetical protein